MKNQLFILAASMLLLASCGGNSPAQTTSEAETQTASSQVSSEAKSSEAVSPTQESSEEEVDTSEEKEKESQEEIVESTEEAGSAEISENFVGDWTITQADVEEAPKSGYPDPYQREIETSGGEKVTLRFVDVERGQGKFGSAYADPYIQMRKITGGIYSLTPLKGTLSVRMIYNYVEYSSTDCTGYPVIKEADSFTGIDDVMGINDYERDEENGIVTFSMPVDGYLGIVANESYAGYFESISFTAGE